MPQPTVSIIIPTYNRKALLQRCLKLLYRNTCVDKEVIVVEGGSTDGTREWLGDCKDCEGLKVILEDKPEGSITAHDRGFRAATGTHLAWINDDAYYLPGSLEAALAFIQRPDLSDVGIVGFYHNMRQKWNRLDEVIRDGQAFHFYNVRTYPYANFGLMRRELMEQLGFLDRRFRACAWDPDISLAVQIKLGLKVIGCRQAIVYHDELMDDRKMDDVHQYNDEDNAKLFIKWDLPEKNTYPDPAPAYQDMLRRRRLTEPDWPDVR